MAVRFENIETMDLVVFDAVMATGSMSQAAASLRLSSPSVSSRIANLELKLGTSLFTRGSRGVKPTSTGTAFGGYASRCLELLSESHRAITEPRRQRVTIAAPASIGTGLFARILTAANSTGLDIHCRIAHSVEVLEGVADKTFAAGIVINRPTPSSIKSRRLGTSGLIAVTRSQHPIAHSQRLTLGALAEFGTAVYRWNADATGLAHALEMNRKAAAKPVHLVGLPSIAVEMALNSDFVAVVPEFAADEMLRTNQLVILDVTLPRHIIEIDLVYRAEDDESRSLAAFLAEFPDSLMRSNQARK